MSQLNLSMPLIQKITGALAEHDGEAQDPGVASQYLCAIIGFMLGQQDMPIERKEELLNELSAFMRHVMQDIEQQRTSAPPPPSPPAGDAFGIWKPPAS